MTTDQDRLRELSTQVLEHAEALGKAALNGEQIADRDKAHRSLGFFRLGHLARVVASPSSAEVRFLSLGTGLTTDEVTHALRMLAACAAIGIPEGA